MTVIKLLNKAITTRGQLLLIINKGTDILLKRRLWLNNNIRLEPLHQYIGGRLNDRPSKFQFRFVLSPEEEDFIPSDFAL